MFKRMVRHLFVGHMTRENIPNDRIRRQLIMGMYSLGAYTLYFQWRAYKAEEALFIREIEELRGEVETQTSQIRNIARRPTITPGFLATLDEDGVPNTQALTDEARRNIDPTLPTNADFDNDNPYL